MKRTERRPIVVGITGIMGSGKSTVSEVFRAMGAAVIDADRVGKHLLGRPALRRAVAEAFGTSVLLPGGGVDTRRLGRLAFASPEGARMLDDLTRAPLVSSIKRCIRGLKASNDVIVVDAALLPEWDARTWLDLVLVVDADQRTALKRLSQGSKFDRRDVLRRMARQFPRGGKLMYGDVVLPNYGTVEDLRRRAGFFFRKVTEIV